MKFQREDVSMEHQVINSANTQDNKPSLSSNIDGSESSLNLESNNSFRKWQLRIIGILLFAFAILLFVALASYSPKDDINTEISLKELFGIFSGSDLLRARADMTENYLGIVGAVISRFIFNATIGYSIIFLPVFIAMWAKNLIQKQSILETTIRKTIFFLVLATMFSFFTASLQNLWFPGIPFHWSGALGYFIVALFSGLLGKYGSLLIMILSLIISLIIISRILPSGLLGRTFNKISLKLKSIFSKNKVDLKENIIQNSTKDDPVESIIITSDTTFINTENREPEYNTDDLDEPARIIRKNVNIEKNNQGTEHSPFSDENTPYSPMRNLRTFEPHNPKKITQDYSSLRPLSIKIENKEPVIPSNEKQKDPIPEIIKEVNTFSKEKSFEEPIEYDFGRGEQSEIIAEHEQQKSVIEQPFVTPINFSDDTESLQINIQKAETDFIEETPEETNVNDTTVTERLILELQSDIEAKRNFADDTSLNILKPLNVLIEQIEDEPFDDEIVIEPISILGTSIHDENINYRIPDISLLVEQEEETKIDDEELKTNARLLQEKLETFKVYIENLTVTPGPVVTQYEFVPAAGIKISRIESFADDIAMALKARGIRIIAPVPGKGTVGIEIPNHHPSTVRFSSLIKSPKLHNSDFKLPIVLGKTISGEVYISDLAKMPHLLIAGSTGSGKSVGINTIIASLLFKKHPSELKFVIVDPKKVELRQYGMLDKHFLAASPDIDSLIITNPEEAVIVLKAVCAEMDQRYELLAEAGQRNILDYNQKVLEGKFDNDKETIHRPIPYIVVIIDELADLMLTASKDIEPPIIRLAQLGRAAGIHLVVATQRPSVDVITGIIKANFPARIAYLVASRIDSRTILDMQGAEQLLGNGDMLLLPNGSPKPIRIQNAFISTDEVEDLCQFISKQQGYSQPYMLPSLVDKDNTNNIIAKEDRDPLFEEAARLMVRHQQGSVSLIQRRLKVGYARAGRIVDELEAWGVVGPFDGSKARMVLIQDESDLEDIL
ncbi:MAG: DNA translocase FtsK 4TM domain-containing protein [Bacteroidota bacterium]